MLHFSPFSMVISVNLVLFNAQLPPVCFLYKSVSRCRYVEDSVDFALFKNVDDQFNFQTFARFKSA